MPSAESDFPIATNLGVGCEVESSQKTLSKTTRDGPQAPTNTGNSRRRVDWLCWLEFLCLLAAIIVVAAEPVPGVNESHYLPKAKHAVDPEFAAQDLFLQSHDSHGLSALLAGYLAKFVPLVAVAWVGRLLSWCFMAWAWQRLRKSLGLSPSIGLLALLSWYFAVSYGNWAGEWAIGGFEGKAIAYGCVVVALAEIYQCQWWRAWLWLGFSVAWHPLAGGWAGLSIGLVWLTLPNLWQRAKSQSRWLGLATLLGLVGVLPAASGLQGPNQVGQLVASSVHVYFRLQHHLCPSLFSWERNVAGLISLALLIAASFYAFRTRSRVRASGPEQSAVEYPWLLAIAWCSLLFCGVGLAIDWSLSTRRPDIASVWLRFYWFRWSDIIVPLAWTLTFWRALNPAVQRLTSDLSEVPKSANRKRQGPFTVGALLAGLGAIVVGGLLVARAREIGFRQHPVADDLVMTAPANREIDSDRYIDWLAACTWIRENSPEDSLWFTPEYQQTFKWYAQRAEVVCWKDVPQDNESVRQWYERIRQCRPSRTVDGRRMEWTSQQLMSLARKYQFRWVLVDRRIQESVLLDFEFMYPVNTQNKSFAIFRIPEMYFVVPKGNP